MSLPVRTTARADGHVRRAAAWWRAKLDAEPEQVTVVAIWGAVRGRMPKLGR